jgi:1-phosphofructokinase family hexose kinase
MIVTVTPNPAVDVTYQVGAMRPGRTHRIETAYARAGGKGINVSRVLRQMGIPTLAISTAGGATGEAFTQDLAASQVPHQLVPVTQPTRQTVTITVTDNSIGPTLFSEPGHPLDEAATAQLLNAVRDQLGRASALVCSGSLPPATTPDLYARIVTMGHEHGVPVIVDGTGAALEGAIRAGADVIKPNLDELRTVSRQPDVWSAARELQLISGGAVVVSMAEAGMLAVVGDGAYRAHLPAPAAGNSTGAGDAAVAALASGTMTDMPWPERLRLAVAWSAGAVATPMAGSVNPEVCRRAAEDARVEVLNAAPVTSPSQLPDPEPGK